ncbi:hypothetical protein GCM10023310_26840 [Paenibacillus vulneris]|uniref:Uncharacterized protein n=1 Tax=Paenibacillus vulneris TaxID=1133364 RepID=A0ABW3UT47_9BACL|nr:MULTISPECIES: hypothetical protein [unclassified Paenibacillus]MBE1446844.1 hypothetical protein [Paenibacillus sp. OAS669]
MSVKIQEIPRFIFDELLVLIGEKTRERLLKLIHKDEEDSDAALSIENYIRNIMNNIFFNDDDVVDLLEIKSTYHRRRQLTKKNWYKQLKKEVESKNNTSIHEEREVLLQFLDSKSADAGFKEMLKNIKDESSFVQNRLAEIEAWANDTETRLTDYPYLESKQQYQIEKAFENDLVYIIADFLKNAPRNWITHRFKDLIDNPIFADGKAKLKGNVLFDSEQKATIIYDDYKMSDNRVLRSFISIEENEEVQLDKMFLLDETDSEILEHIIEHRSERFYTDKTIAFDIRPLLTRIYGNTSQKAYDLITKRLQKIGRFSLEGRTTGPNKETKTTFLYNLFEYVIVSKEDATGRRYAEIKFSDTLHQQFITKQTVQIYSHFIHRLENRLSKILIYAFQKERLDAYLQGRKMKQNFEYSFFSDRIRFRSKRIDSNLKQIDASLQEFKEANILINDYKRVGNGFEIILTPVTESEKADFFTAGSTPSLIQ